MSITLHHVPSATDDARSLIAELDAELAGPYAAEQRHGLSVDRVFRPGILFLVARVDGAAAGCGGISFEAELGEGLAELKRMYVRPAHRGRGLGRALIARLEAEARARGVGRVALETGDAQVAAIRVYERAGYRRCGAFGPYATMDPRAVERSVFFEKWVG